MRYQVRDDEQGGYGVWDIYLRAWVESDLGDVGLDLSDAEILADEMNIREAALTDFAR